MIVIRQLMALTLFCAVVVSARHRNVQPEEPVEFTNDESSLQTPEDPRDNRQHINRHRRKRWYSSYGYNQPGIYRDDNNPGPNQGSYPGPYDPFAYIYKRLDELAALIRQPYAPPPPPPAPIFVPYPVFIPQANCGCQGQPGVYVPTTPTNTTPTMIPDFPNRLKPDEADDYDDEPIAPINFTPILPDRPLSKPPPSVDHGSSQAGASTGQQGRDPISAPPQASFSGNQPPSRCDLAILTCCHQKYATEQCFNSLGCPRANRSATPCDSRQVTNVIRVFQNFYAQT